MFAHIGRQAIYNRDFVIAGYELLYRNGSRGNTAVFLDGDAATRSLLSDAVNIFGIQELTGGLPAYINFTRNLLLEDFAYLAKPREIIIEVPGDVYLDGALIGKINSLKTAGYRLSLDGYNPSNSVNAARLDRILRQFDVIRLNLGEMNRSRMTDLVEKLSRGRARLLAERVETEADFELALELNFSLFQGFYFEKPTCMSKQIPLGTSAYGRMLRELLRDDVSFECCGEIIASDAILTHTFLRQVVGSLESGGKPEREIRQGLVTAGTEGVRRWFGLVLLKQGNITGSDDLPRRAFLRARFVQRLTENARTRIDPGIGFFLGLFSLVDQVIGVRMTDLVSDLRLNPAMGAALLGQGENEYARFLQYAVIFEMGNERLILPDIGLKISPREASALYMECMAEADAAFAGGAGTTLEVY